MTALVAAIRSDISEHEREVERHVSAIARLSEMEAIALSLETGKPVSRPEPRPPVPDVPAGEKPPPPARPSRPRRSSLDRPLDLEALGVLRNGPATGPEIRERLGISSGTWGGVSKRLLAAGKIERDGTRPGAGGGQPAIVWRLPDEATTDEPDATDEADDGPENAPPSLNGDGEGTLEGRALAFMVHGARKVSEVADHIDKHPAVAAQIVKRLVDEGEVERQSDGRYVGTL